MKFFKSSFRFRGVLILICFTVFIAATEVFARLGGGGGYRSSGGGSSFGGGSSWGGSSSLGGSSGNSSWIDFFVYALIFIIIAGAKYLLYGEKSIPSLVVSKKLRRGFQDIDHRRVSNVLNAIKYNDVNFDIDKFSHQLKLTFIKMQWAMANGKLKTCRHFFSDGMFERVKLLEKLNELCYLHNHIENIVVNDITVIDAKRGDGFERLDIKIDAAARDYYVDSRNKRFLCGDKKQQTFTEVWTLLRCGDVKTRENSQGLFSKHCPNCGNSLELVDEIICSYCNARVNTGNYDWVLTEITQMEEWLKQTNISSQAFNNLKQKDPGFNLASVEDKISVIFWRNIAARMCADIKYVSRFAAPHFVEKYKKIYKKEANGNREFYTDVAVGAVELREAVLNCADGYDRIRAKVKWSCRIMNTNLPKLIAPNFDKSRYIENDIILKRKTEVKSPVANGLSSNVCPNCGATEGKQFLPHCEYCHVALNNGSRDWVLDDITVFDDYSEYGLLQKKYAIATQKNNDKKAKKVVDEKKVNMLSDSDISTLLWLNNDMTGQNSQQLNNTLIQENSETNGNRANLNSQLTDNNKIVSEKRTSVIENLVDINKESVLLCAIAVMYADGVVDDNEYKSLIAMGESMNFNHKHVDYLIDYAMTEGCAIEAPTSQEGINELLSAMAVMAMADGRITKDERELMYQLGNDIGVDKKEVKKIIKDIEQKLLAKIARM